MIEVTRNDRKAARITGRWLARKMAGNDKRRDCFANARNDRKGGSNDRKVLCNGSVRFLRGREE